ncbi:stage III sporulation protein AA [Mediterraneibacter sp. NSJ-55]|uniref:Stage III sporulation protein AA n=1 Tax=Mediterraneibacter hominis TaxID=2763054 RepID=A0A923LH33_9FIRM|nr:stage III sporulation protein AA [Mediterraneibacter hominis]MBC5688017.1 stage III sporulation protein AA [Mediterraneibacter hominis]
MDAEKRKSQILQVLAKSVRKVLEDERLDFTYLQEIRLRIGQPLRMIYRNEEKTLPVTKKEKCIVTKEEVRETMEYISHYSLYAYENELKQGFLTIEGGHRAGVTGKVIVEQGKVKNIQYISSINIRMSHEILGCSEKILPYITKNRQVCHTLIISPPRCGKTTLIRDLVRQISDGNTYVKGCTVGVVDERSELGGCYLGVAQNHLGSRTDVLDCCPKAEGMIMLIRSMAPQVIAVDEIGTQEDIHAIEYAMQCGCKMIASVHSTSMEEAKKKPILGELIRRKRFERYVVLQNEEKPGEIQGIYDERGSMLCKECWEAF